MGQRTFRARLWLRLAMAVAAVFWAAVLALLAHFPGAPASTLLSAAAFLAFFALFGAHYGRLAIDVGPEGVVFRTFFRRVPIRWDEILRVEVYAGLAGPLYAVLTRQGLVQFTGLLARHRELLEIVLERAGLSRFR